MLGVVADAAVLQLSGCGTQSLSSGSDFDDVMKDPKAAADEFIAAAGPPDEIVRNAYGSRPSGCRADPQDPGGYLGRTTSGLLRIDHGSPRSAAVFSNPW